MSEIKTTPNLGTTTLLSPHGEVTPLNTTWILTNVRARVDQAETLMYDLWKLQQCLAVCPYPIRGMLGSVQLARTRARWTLGVLADLETFCEELWEDQGGKEQLKTKEVAT